MPAAAPPVSPLNNTGELNVSQAVAGRSASNPSPSQVPAELGESAAPEAVPSGATPIPTKPEGEKIARTPAEKEKGGFDAYDALDAIGRDEEEESARSNKPVEKKAKAPDKAEPEERPQPEEKPLKTADLRKNYDALKTKDQTNEKRIAELEAKLKETPKDDPEKKVIADKLAAAEKRAAEIDAKRAKLEETLMYADYRQSDDYKDKYEKPYTDAWAEASNRIKNLKTAKKVDEETGAVMRESRKGTFEDLQEIVAMADDDTAAEVATDLFGNKASIVLHHRERIHSLNVAATNAVAEFEKKGGQIRQQQMEALKAHKSEYDNELKRNRDEAVAKYPQYFGEDPNDPEHNKLLAQARSDADRLYSDEPMSPKDRAALEARVYNKATGFDTMARRWHQRGKRIKELEAKLAAYEKAEPGAGDANGRNGDGTGGGRGRPATAADAFDAYAATKSGR